VRSSLRQRLRFDQDVTIGGFAGTHHCRSRGRSPTKAERPTTAESAAPGHARLRRQSTLVRTPGPGATFQAREHHAVQRALCDQYCALVDERLEAKKKDCEMFETYRMLGREHEADLLREAVKVAQASRAQGRPLSAKRSARFLSLVTRLRRAARPRLPEGSPSLQHERRGTT
jgi:hypothetical protein